MIRKYVAQDLEDLIDAWYQASRLAHPFLEEAFLDRERKSIEEIYMPLAETWVYETDEKVVGFISLIGREVGALFVHPAFHRRGIGWALVDHARKLRDELEVDVFKANEIGRRFYARCGFEHVMEHIHNGTGQPLLRLKLPSER